MFLFEIVWAKKLVKIYNMGKDWEEKANVTCKAIETEIHQNKTTIKGTREKNFNEV